MSDERERILQKRVAVECERLQRMIAGKNWREAAGAAVMVAVAESKLHDYIAERDRRSFRAADTVKHGPSGEEWDLGCDEDNGEVFPNGWPPTIARASDCTLVEAASDKDRLAMLREWAARTSAEVRCDARRLTAIRQLIELGEL